MHAKGVKRGRGARTEDMRDRVWLWCPRGGEVVESTQCRPKWLDNLLRHALFVTGHPHYIGAMTARAMVPFRKLTGETGEQI